MTDEFDGRVALVTGAGSGLGEAIALRLGLAGASVVLIDRDAQAARRVERELTPGRTLAVTADVTDAIAVDRAVAAALDHFGRLDLAVNNAGISQPNGEIADLAEADWRRVIDVNLTGVFLCLRAQIQAMRATGAGAIVNMASALGVIGAARVAAYVASKHAVVGLTKSAALECAGDGIRVNAVAPGVIDTPLVANAVPTERKAALRALHPLDRFGTPGEVAELVCFLLSDRASFITGSVHLADGGWSAA